MGEWERQDTEGEEYDNKLLFDNPPAMTAAAWRKDYEYIGIYDDDGTYWVLYESGGMQRIAEDFESEDEAFDFAEELRSEY